MVGFASWGRWIGAGTYPDIRGIGCLLSSTRMCGSDECVGKAAQGERGVRVCYARCAWVGCSYAQTILLYASGSVNWTEDQIKAMS